MNPFIRVLLIAFICVGAVFAQNVADVSRLDLNLTVKGHAGSIYGLAYNRDGTLLVTGGSDGTARLWNVATGQEIRKFVGHQAFISGIAFSRDNRFVVTGSDDSTTRVWNVETGKEVIKYNSGTFVTSVAISSDGQSVATGTFNNGLHIWKLNNPKQAHIIKPKSPHVIFSVAFSIGGKFIAGSILDDIVTIWDAETGEVIREFIGHTKAVRSVAFSPNGSLLLTGSDDLSVRLWDIPRGNETRRFTGEMGVFSPDGRQILTNVYDTAFLWDSGTGQEVSRFIGHTNFVNKLAFSPDGRTITTGSWDNTIRVWSSITGQEIRRLEGHQNIISALAFSSDARLLITGSSDSFIRIWDTKSGKQTMQISHPEEVSSLSTNATGNLIAVGSWKNTVRILELRTGKKMLELNMPSDVSDLEVSFSPNGELLASGNKFDKLVKLWNVGTGELVRQFEGRTYAFNPNGKVLATTNDEFVDFWEISTGKYISRMKVGDVDDLDFNSDGRILAISTFEDGVSLWDTEKSVKIAQITKEGSHTLAFSPNGRVLATSNFDQIVQLWDVATRKEIRQLKGHLGDVYNIVFSADGTRIATGSIDTARIYSTPELAPIFGSRAVTNPSPSMATIPQIPVSTSFNQSLKPVSPHQSIDATLKGCIRINTANPETVTCRISFALLSGETPVQAVSIRGIDTASRVVTPYQYGFLIPNAVPSKNATLTTSTPLTLEFYMSVAKDIVILPILDVKVGNSSLWEYTARFTQVPIGK